MPGEASPPDDAATVTTGSAGETRRWGERCGRLLSSPLVLFLIGDLGSGKTLFVQGLARGLDVPAGSYVTSPSFTIVNEYPGRLPLCHIDLYRLEANLDPEDLGLGEILHGEGVAAVEWADRLPAGAVAERLEIRFEIAADERRILQFKAYGQAPASLLKALDRWTGPTPADPVRP
jgi:tRNA threonylcarbamoyladenosine biosynthesis protein TsaE